MTIFYLKMRGVVHAQDTRKIEMWQISFSSTAMAHICDLEDVTIDLLRVVQS
jgi:hypothetical protein